MFYLLQKCFSKLYVKKYTMKKTTINQQYIPANETNTKRNLK